MSDPPTYDWSVSPERAVELIEAAWEVERDVTPPELPETMPERWQVLAIANEHPNDRLVRFDHKSHRYALSPDGLRWSHPGHDFPNTHWSDPTDKYRVSEVLSVSGIMDRYLYTYGGGNFGTTQRDLGTKMHKLIERHLNGDVPSAADIAGDDKDLTHEWQCFLAFYEAHKDGLMRDVVRTEWMIGSARHMASGTIDCIVATERHPDGRIKKGIVIDWKTSTKRHNPMERFKIHCVEFPGAIGGQQGNGMTKLQKYETQAMLYAKILEEAYDGIEIVGCVIVTFSREYAPSDYALPTFDAQGKQLTGEAVHQFTSDRTFVSNKKTVRISDRVWELHLRAYGGRLANPRQFRDRPSLDDVLAIRLYDESTRFLDRNVGNADFDRPPERARKGRKLIEPAKLDSGGTERKKRAAKTTSAKSTSVKRFLQPDPLWDSDD